MKSLDYSDFFVEITKEKRIYQRREVGMLIVKVQWEVRRGSPENSKTKMIYQALVLYEGGFLYLVCNAGGGKS